MREAIVEREWVLLMSPSIGIEASVAATTEEERDELGSETEDAAAAEA